VTNFPRSRDKKWLVFGSRITSTFPTISLCYARTVRWTGCAAVLEVQMPKPRAVSEHIVVPSIGSREIARAQRSVSGAAKMRSKARDLGNSLLGVQSPV
jgi:hypothetical protein